MPARDIVVIGASAGGLEPLAEIVDVLPGDFPGSIFIAQHMEPGFRTLLPELLGRRGKLRVSLALHGEPIQPSHIYVAPPDNHLVVRPGYVHVTRGPKENGHRPSVDVLFRSAAAAYGPRVIGVVLSGYHDCGTSGLLSIKARGGTAMVQRPDLALAKDMPQSALEHVAIDQLGTPRQIGERLVALSGEPVPAPPESLSSTMSELEGDEPGLRSEVVCPLCNGALTETTVNGYQSFRCHVGHAFSLNSLAVEQAESLEQALWSAVRALEESATIASRLAQNAPASIRDRFHEKHRTQRQAARIVENLLRSEGILTPQDTTEKKSN
jgi:two-component system, chemotaxis family, protein-glutamate methylesterase/glutaminase